MADPAGLGFAAQAALHALADPNPRAARTAEDHLVQALAAADATPVDQVNVTLLRARLAARLGHLAQAAALAGQALGCARDLDPQDADAIRLLVQALADTADFRLAAGARDTALLLEALDLAHRYLGDIDPDTAAVWNSVGMHHRYAGRLDDAAAAYQQAQRCGSDAPDPAILHNLASLAHLRGELAEAEQLIRKALALRADDQLGRSADIAVLAAILGDAGRFTDAEREYHRARTLLLAQHGPASIELLYLDANLVVLRQRQGRLREADVLATSVLAAAKAAFGADHPQTGVVLANQARVAAALGDTARALVLAQQAVRVLQARADDTLPALVAARDLLGELTS